MANPVEVRSGIRVVAGIQGNSLSADAIVRRFLVGESLGSIALLYNIRGRVVENVVRWYLKNPHNIPTE